MTDNSSRIFVGNISEKVREDDILKEFGRFGKIKRVDLKEKFAFLFYEDERNGEDAIRELNGFELFGSKLIVQYARISRERLKEDTLAVLKNNRLIIENLDPKTSWQNIKDWARAAGMVSFTNVFSKDGKKIGIVEFEDSTDIKEAIHTLQGIPLLNMDCRLEKDEGQYGDQSRPIVNTANRPFQDRRAPFSGGGYHNDRDNFNRGDDRDRRPNYASGSGARGGGYDDRDRHNYGGDRDNRSRAPPVASAPYYDNRNGGGGSDRRPAAAPIYDDRKDSRSDSRDRDRRPAYSGNGNDNRRSSAPVSNNNYDDDRSRRPPQSSANSYDDRDRDRRAHPPAYDDYRGGGGGGGDRDRSRSRDRNTSSSRRPVGGSNGGGARGRSSERGGGGGGGYRGDNRDGGSRGGGGGWERR